MLLHELQKLRCMPSRDRKLFLQVALIVPFIEMSLRLVGFKRASSWLRRFARTTETAANPEAEVERHRRLLFLLHRRIPFVGGCLARAIAIWFLLQRKGIATDLRFGVRRRTGTLEVHAWVEYKEKPLTLDPRVQEHYSFFPGPTLPLIANQL